jgi:PKD repeat protein
MPRDPRRRASMSSWTIKLAGAFVASLVLLALASAVAYAADLGHKDGPYVNGSGGITGSKPESKLWWNDGLWWGSIWDDATSDFFIYKLDPATDSWVKTAIRLDDRKGTRADTLWDGTHLYVASQLQSDSATAGSNPARLYRFSYNAGSKTYTNDAGGTSAYATIRTGSKLESLVIAKDSGGTLWATWTQPSGSNRIVYTNHTIGNDATWSTGVALPAAGTTVTSDDISSIISFKLNGSQTAVGVFWSNQTANKDYFAYHVDGAADSAWTGEVALAVSANNAKPADDHINLKTDSTGRVFAVVKNGNDTSGKPEIELLVRPAGGGSWSESVVATGNVHTRPMLLLDESANTVHVFLTGPTPPDTSGVGGGTIFEKTSSMTTISFASGVGTARIRDDASPGMNNPTSTKQNLTPATGLVVLASNDSSTAAGHRNYWHYKGAAGGGGGAPVADFNANPTSGPPGQTVAFTDLSTNAPSEWAWDFGDPSSLGLNTSTSQNPSHQYAAAGQYTVSLTATNGSGPGSVTKSNYITITGGGGSTITLNPDADTQVKMGSTSNLGADVQLRTREENPVASTTYRSFLRFNVQGLTGTVNTVKLRLWVDAVSSNTQTVYNTTTSNPNWPELTTNGGNAPAIGSTAYGSSTASPADAYKEISLLPSSIGGNGLVTFALKSNGTTSAYFSSKEGAHSPQLVITQTVVSSPPVADFSATPTAATPGTNVVFSDLSTNTPNGWDWDFGDGSAHGSTKNPSHNYSAIGDYTVTLTASNDSGPGAPVSKIGYIKIGNAPLASFTADPTSGPAALSVHFVNTSDSGTGPTTWAWDFDGNGTTDDTTQDPADHVYSSGGTFMAKLTATSIYGSSNTTQQIVVTGPPTADFSGTPTVIHPGDAVQFTDLSTGSPTGWDWDFGDGLPHGSTVNPSHLYSAVGTYNVTLVSSNTGGDSAPVTKNAYIKVGTAPTAAFSANPASGNAPLNVSFTNSSTGTGPLTYAWDFDNNGSVDDSTSAPSHVFAAGSYTVKLTVSSIYGTNSTTHPVTASSTSSTITVPVAFDAHVNSANVGTNYGNLTPIRTREDSTGANTYRPYFQFNVPAFSGSVSSVKLRLYVTTGSTSVTQSVFLVGNGWTEAAINWTNAPVLPAGSIGSAVAGTTGAYVEFTLTTPIVSNTTYSFALKSSGSSSVYFNSDDSATNKPELVIVTGP